MDVGATSPFSGRELPHNNPLDQVQLHQSNSVSMQEIASSPDVKDLIFNRIKSGEINELNEWLTALDPLQKSKYFSTAMKFETGWADDEEEMKPMQYACFLGNLKAVQVLIDHGASVNDFGNTSASTQRGSIHFALDANHPEIALLLLEKGAKDKLASCKAFYAFRKYNLPVEWGGSWTCLTALHMSIIMNMPKVAEKLLKVGDAAITCKASGSNSCLHLAARECNEEMIKLLFAHGAKSLLSVKDQSGQTPKDIAVVVLAKKQNYLMGLFTHGISAMF